MRRVIIVAVLAVLGSFPPSVEAKWGRGSTPNPNQGVVPGAEGRKSWAGVAGLGGPVPRSYTKPGHNPVVGSVKRSGLFVNPFSGRTRYTGKAYNPTTGRFGKYHFRQ